MRPNKLVSATYSTECNSVQLVADQIFGSQITLLGASCPCSIKPGSRANFFHVLRRGDKDNERDIVLIKVTVPMTGEVWDVFFAAIAINWNNPFPADLTQHFPARPECCYSFDGKNDSIKVTANGVVYTTHPYYETNSTAERYAKPEEICKLILNLITERQLYMLSVLLKPKLETE